MEVHTEFPRPELPAGAHLARCLLSAPPSMLEKLIVFAHGIVRDEDGSDLGEVMAAVGLDALAALHTLDDQLGDILDGIV